MIAPYAAPQTGGQNDTPHIPGDSGGPVHYGNGEIQLAVTDLSVSGFGLDFGHTRIFSNRLNGDFDFGNGYNWLVRDLPQLIEEDDNTVLMLQGTRGAMWFDLIGGKYVGRYGTKFTLVHNDANGTFTLATPNGQTLVFNDFNVANAGLFQSQTTAGGQVLQVTSYAPGTALGIGEVQRSYATGGVSIIESFLYNHAGDDLGSVLLRRKIGSGGWQNVRQVLYAYYGDNDPNGSFGDLKTATVQTFNAGAWQTIENNYYRYWTIDGGGGLWHGLKYVVGGAAYDRMVSA
ncbi:MAG: RHS repeat-associated core domain-containing protein, partial [Gemmataceae bacterium]